MQRDGDHLSRRWGLRNAVFPAALAALVLAVAGSCSVEDKGDYTFDKARGGQSPQGGSTSGGASTSGTGGTLGGSTSSTGGTSGGGGGGGGSTSNGGSGANAGSLATGGSSGSPGLGGTAGDGAAGEGGAAGEAGAPGCTPPLVDCGTGCINPNTSTLHCGGCDSPCEGDQVCAGGECAADCGTLTLCDDECADLETDANHCLDCDTTCPAPESHGSAVCTPNGCDIECGSNSLLCGDACCDPAPSRAEITCQGSQCGVQCLLGNHACLTNSAPCYANDDVQHCGSDCEDCREPNTSSACVGGACEVTCLGSTLDCPLVDGRPSCGTWNFESGTTEEWYIFDTTFPQNGRFEANTEHPHAGNYSLAVDFDADTTLGSSQMDLRVFTCKEGNGFSAAGATISFWISFVTDPASPYELVGSDNASFLVIIDGYSGCDFYPPVNTWHEVSCDVDFNSPPKDVFEFSIIPRVVKSGVHWQGTVYIDDISLDFK